MILQILFIMTMFLWFLSVIPIPAVASYGWAGLFLAWFAVLLLGIFLFVPALR